MSRSIFTPQPVTWHSWCNPLLCHFHFAVAALLLYKPAVSNGNPSSVREGGLSKVFKRCGFCLWAVCRALLADEYDWEQVKNVLTWQLDDAVCECTSQADVFSLDPGFELPVFKSLVSCSGNSQIFMFCNNSVHGKLTCKLPLMWIWVWQCLWTLQLEGAVESSRLLTQNRFFSYLVLTL